jgi:AcrR family transcriptional regulator
MTAASHLFGSREYESVTVADICAEARVSKRYFYDHFVDRSDLLMAVHREHNDWLLASATAAAPQGSASLEEFVRPILRRLVELLYEDAERARIIYINAPRMEPQRRALLRAEADQFGELLRPFVAPSLAGSHYSRTLLALVAGATEVIIDWLARDMPEDPVDLADHLCWLCCAVLSRPSPPDRT